MSTYDDFDDDGRDSDVASRSDDTPNRDTNGERLQKVLARAGVASRRASELLISEGRVDVNGEVVDTLGARVDPEVDLIRVDGERIITSTRATYLMLNKPRGVVTTMDDPQGRPCIGDMLIGRSDRLFHVGRLDTDTEGLLLLTNDGEIANKLAHPSYGVSKTYVAQVKTPVARDAGRRLKEGFLLEDGPVQAEAFRVIQQNIGKALVEIVVHEGRKHVVRRMLEAVGNPVETLTRTQFGPLHLGDLRLGKMRPLDNREIAALLDAASGDPRPRTTGGPRKKVTPWTPLSEQGEGQPVRRPPTGGRPASGRPSSGRPTGRTAGKAERKPSARRGEPRPSEGYKPRSSEGYRPRSDEGFKPRSSEGSGRYEPRSGPPRSGAPRSGAPRSGGPRPSEGYRPRSDEGFKPRSSEGSGRYEPRSGPPRSGAPRSGAPRSGGPRPSEGYKPRSTEGYKPRSGDGYQPRSGGSRAPDGSGYKPRSSDNRSQPPRSSQPPRKPGHRPKGNPR